MAKFEVEEFGYDAGSFDQLVFHAKKFTKEKAVGYFNEEYAYKGLKATIDDVKESYAKYYIHATQQMSSDWEDGCYGFAGEKERGAFPVLVITLSDLSLADMEKEAK